MGDSVIGTEVEGYRIQEVLGRGGMGVVYKAEDIALSRSVALKRIDPSLANDESFLRRFRSEAQALARIDSTYIVRVHALRQTDIGLLIVMEYVDGGTLKDVILEGPMDWQEALPIIKQMLTALEHAHGAEVIHRDIKPRNVMLSAEGTVKVTDFGLAKVHRSDSRETVTQGVHGTLNYMSPEQVQGSADLDHRSDLYSLGMTIYEMLTGELPFDEDSSEFTKMRSIVEEEFPPPDEVRPDLSEGISSLVMKALEKSPDDRFQSAEVMRDAFDAFEEKQSSSEATPHAHDRVEAGGAMDGRQWRQVGVVIALVALLGIGGYFVYTPGTGTSSAGVAETEEGSSSTQARIKVSTEPIGADIYHQGELLGVTPFTHTVQGKLDTLRIQKQGYEETTVTVDGTRASLTVPLEQEGPGQTVADAQSPEESTKTGPQADNGSDSGGGETSEATSDPAPPPEQGTLILDARPSGTVFVDGEAHSAGQSIRVPTGTHKLRFEHPEYDTVKDTTVRVAPDDTHELTCYFTHEVTVRAQPSWASVYLNGENTTKDTPYNTELGPGRHQIRAHVAEQRGWEVTGGEYRRSVGGERRAGEFSGRVKTITLRPAFEQQTHVIDFRLSENGS